MFAYSWPSLSNSMQIPICNLPGFSLVSPILITCYSSKYRLDMVETENISPSIEAETPISYYFVLIFLGNVNFWILLYDLVSTHSH